MRRDGPSAALLFVAKDQLRDIYRSGPRKLADPVFEASEFGWQGRTERKRANLLSKPFR
jgi:hypothetical protein